MADLRGMPADLSRSYPPPPRLAPAQLRGGLGASDAHPFISGADEPDFDPLADFRRTLELTGERWLSFSEAVALLREREPMSIGYAEHILDDLRVAYFAAGGPFARQSGKSVPVRWYFVRGIGLLEEKPHRENTFVSEADLIYWLDQNWPAPKSAPSPRPARMPAPRASKTQISKIVAEYSRTDPNPTMDGACQFAQSKGVTGHQAAVRDQYRIQFGHPRVGRRRKNP